MTTSDDTLERLSELIHRLLNRPLPPVSRYDALLALIPFTFVLSLLLSAAGVLPTGRALLVAGGIGALAVVDGLFIDPPTGLDR